jgi:hypothetical protein
MLRLLLLVRLVAAASRQLAHRNRMISATPRLKKKILHKTGVADPGDFCLDNYIKGIVSQDGGQGKALEW